MLHRQSAFLDDVQAHQVGEVSDGPGVVAIVGNAVQGCVVVLRAGAEDAAAPVGQQPVRVVPVEVAQAEDVGGDR